ncbi:hypothetical protein [Nisaea sp.]|uniref:hypothetical protein n=1 Tax=Nisaea sp. TaxID=2024842 RepID=UPI003297C33A
MPVIKVNNINAMDVCGTTLEGSARQVTPGWKLLPGGFSGLCLNEALVSHACVFRDWVRSFSEVYDKYGELAHYVLYSLAMSEVPDVRGCACRLMSVSGGLGWLRFAMFSHLLAVLTGLEQDETHGR